MPPRLALANSMAELLGMNDLKDICLALNIDFRGVESESIRLTALNLIDVCERETRLSDLLAVYKQLKPQAPYWNGHAH